MYKTLKILHLEDCQTDAELVERELKKQNIIFLKLVVDNKEDFVKNLIKFSPDVILSDHSLPSFSSFEALKILGEKGSRIPFILVAGNVSEEFAIEMMKHGVSDFILKSSLKRLPAAILEAVEKRELQIEKEKVELEILQMNAELKSLNAHFQTIREEERATLAREIHDELGQQLIRLKMDFIWLSTKIKDPNDEITGRISASIVLVDETVEIIRRINTKLRPRIIDDLGLFAALEWEVAEFTKHTGIPCKFKTDLNEPDLSKFLSIHIFRIFQEALTNVARHAHASEVNAKIKYMNGNLMVTIEDNGKGIDTEKLKNGKSFGLLGMKERAAMMNGIITIRSKPAHGTTILLNVPVIN